MGCFPAPPCPSLPPNFICPGGTSLRAWVLCHFRSAVCSILPTCSSSSAPLVIWHPRCVSRACLCLSSLLVSLCVSFVLCVSLIFAWTSFPISILCHDRSWSWKSFVVVGFIFWWSSSPFVIVTVFFYRKIFNFVCFMLARSTLFFLAGIVRFFWGDNILRLRIVEALAASGGCRI